LARYCQAHEGGSITGHWADGRGGNPRYPLSR
jgi:hypothetical protein